uniref:Uncharacterized protein n=1 Tax=Lepeophtheirus salmonis TaxID=72036 RepID=A0A0K2TN87_LEPSM
MQEWMSNSSDKLSHAATIEEISESTFGYDVLLDYLFKVPHIEKSSRFKSCEEGGISLWTRIEPYYLRRAFGLGGCMRGGAASLLAHDDEMTQ